jgi:hypothetical protein
VNASSEGGGTGTTEPADAPGTTEAKGKDKDPGKGKGQGSGEYAEACAALEGLEALDDANGDEDSAATFALMEDARAAGPDELVAHWDTMIKLLGELDALDEESDEALAKAFELFDDPEYLEAASAIDDFAAKECGLDIELDPTEESAGGLTEDTIETDPDADPTSINAVQDHLRTRFGTEDWYEVLDGNVSWGAQGVREITWTVTFGDDPADGGMSEADLVDVCDAMADYLDEHERGDVSVELLDSADAVLVSRDPGEACKAA